MNLRPDSTLLRIARGEERGFVARLTAAGLWTVSVGYGLALKAHLAGYRLGLARRTRLPALVISMGNLTVGGTGKTTASLAVARWLSDRNRRVAILSRGYRGTAEQKTVIVSEGFGPLVTAEAAGDEPYLMARALPEAFVLAGKDRRRTGAIAVEKLKADAIVLDDGFQYQRLERDLDIVLVDALMPFGYDSLVPRGLLREPPAHLARADAVWLTHADLVRRNDVEAVRARVGSLAPQARIWEAIHSPARLRRLAVDEEAEPAELRGRRVCALSSLGNPLAFERGLERLGAQVVARLRFPDHHPYRAQELEEAQAEHAQRAEWVVTTEKDAVRLPEGALMKPTWALQVELAGYAGGPDLSEELTCLLRRKSAM